MPSIQLVEICCEHGTFDADCFSDSGCRACRDLAHKRYESVMSGRYKFLKFKPSGGKHIALDSFRGSVEWWCDEEAKERRTEEVTLLDPLDVLDWLSHECKTWLRSNQMEEESSEESQEGDSTQPLVSSAFSSFKMERYAWMINEFWSMVYHFGGLEGAFEKACTRKEPPSRSVNAPLLYSSSKIEAIMNSDAAGDDESSWADEDEEDEGSCSSWVDEDEE